MMACLVGWLAIGSYSPTVGSHPTLTFAVTSHVVPQKDQPGSPTDEAYPLVAVLGHDFLTVETKGNRTVYDFRTHRLLALDLNRQTYEDYSLYSDIGFRVLEFQNRLMLGGMLKSAKLPAPTMDSVLVENLFSLIDDKSANDVTRRQDGGGTVFESAAHELVRASKATRALPEGYRDEYWRFIRYYAGGHPKALTMLAAAAGVPQSLSLVLTNMKVETRTLALQSITLAPDSPYSLDGFKLVMPDREPYKTLQAVGPDAPAQVANRVAATLTQRDLALAEGHYLQAMLANNETMLSTGDGHRDWLLGARDRLVGDSSTQRLVGALSPHDEASVKQAAEVFRGLRASAGNYVDVLDIFEGNALLSLKQTAEGQALLLAALALDPYIAGAWHDLGDSYYRSFRMPEAWACLDAARRMAPSNPMLQQMNQVEQALRDRNPGFF
jgi:tetratricopeptide (TPR) repeat protein